MNHNSDYMNTPYPDNTIVNTSANILLENSYLSLNNTHAHVSDDGSALKPFAPQHESIVKTGSKLKRVSKYRPGTELPNVPQYDGKVVPMA